MGLPAGNSQHSIPQQVDEYHARVAKITACLHFMKGENPSCRGTSVALQLPMALACKSAVQCGGGVAAAGCGLVSDKFFGDLRRTPERL